MQNHSLQTTYPPYRIRQIIRNNQRAARVDGYAYWAAAGFACFGAKAGGEVDRWPGRFAVAERHKDHFVADRRFAVPAAVLADKHAFAEVLAHGGDGEIQAEGGDVGAEGVVRGDGAGDFFRLLRAHARVDVFAPVAVGPAVKATFAYRGQVIRHQVCAQ